MAGCLEAESSHMRNSVVMCLLRCFARSAQAQENSNNQGRSLLGIVIASGLLMFNEKRLTLSEFAIALEILLQYPLDFSEFVML